MVRLGYLALVGNLPRDGVSIEIIEFTNPQNMSVISNQSFSMNGVKEAGTNSGEGLSPGRCPTEQQSGPGCHRTMRKEVGGESRLKRLIEL